jgi:hypothetical protein
VLSETFLECGRWAYDVLMMVAQVPCFADEFVDWFDGPALRRIISAFSIRVIRVLGIDNVGTSAYYIGARYS